MGAAQITSGKLILDSVEHVLPSDFTTSSTSFSDTGNKVTLSAGKWLIMGRLRATVPAGAGNYAVFRLYNQTDSTAISNTETLVTLGQAAANMHSIPIFALITIAATKVIRVEMKSGGAYSSINTSDTNGRSGIIALRVG